GRRRVARLLRLRRLRGDADDGRRPQVGPGGRGALAPRHHPRERQGVPDGRPPAAGAGGGGAGSAGATMSAMKAGRTIFFLFLVLFLVVVLTAGARAQEAPRLNEVKVPL